MHLHNLILLNQNELKEVSELRIEGVELEQLSYEDSNFQVRNVENSNGVTGQFALIVNLIEKCTSVQCIYLESNVFTSFFNSSNGRGVVHIEKIVSALEKLPNLLFCNIGQVNIPARHIDRVYWAARFIQLSEKISQRKYAREISIMSTACLPKVLLELVASYEANASHAFLSNHAQGTRVQIYDARSRELLNQHSDNLRQFYDRLNKSVREKGYQPIEGLHTKPSIKCKIL